jgi:hypothetical protein
MAKQLLAGVIDGFELQASWNHFNVEILFFVVNCLDCSVLELFVDAEMRLECHVLFYTWIHVGFLTLIHEVLHWNNELLCHPCVSFHVETPPPRMTDD